MSGKLKEISADYAMMPNFTSYSFCEEGKPEPLGYRKDVHIILHLSNQFNDDIAATVNGDNELRIEEEG